MQELQLSLLGCREELNVYLQQMEEVKKSHESELQKKNQTVSSHMPPGRLSISPRFCFVSTLAQPRPPHSSDSLPAGEAPRCHSGLPERRRAERSAAAFSAAAAGHVDGECRSRLRAGGESESAANTGWFGNDNKAAVKYTVHIFSSAKTLGG